MAGPGVYPSAGSSSWKDDNTFLGVGARGWGAIGTAASTAIDVWSSMAQADQQQQMQKNLMNYNNSMRAIVQGVKQFAADKNRAAAGDDNINTQLQIDLDTMRSSSQVDVQAAFTGASSSAKQAAMFDITRNGLQARANQAGQFEHALQQIQLSEYSDNINSIQSTQRSVNTAPSLALGIGSAIGELGSKAFKSGAFNKGSSMRTYFSDLFNKSSAKIPTGE